MHNFSAYFPILCNVIMLTSGIIWEKLLQFKFYFNSEEIATDTGDSVEVEEAEVSQEDLVIDEGKSNEYSEDEPISHELPR